MFLVYFGFSKIRLLLSLTMTLTLFLLIKLNIQDRFVLAENKEVVYELFNILNEVLMR